VPDAWPNIFASPASCPPWIVQADRLRRKVAEEMARVFASVDVLLVPRCATRCSRSPTSPAIHRSPCAPASFEVGQAASDWAPDPAHPMPSFFAPPPLPHGVTFHGKLYRGRHHRRAASARKGARRHRRTSARLLVSRLD